MKKNRNIIFFVFIALLCLGLIMIYSSSAMYSYEKIGEAAYYLKRHLLYIVLGLVFFTAALIIPYRKWYDYLPFLLIFSFLLLFLVLIPNIGYEAGGGRRWLKLFFFQFQPSEAVKLVTVIYLAHFVSRKEKIISDFKRGVLPPLAICFFLAGLILLQPDLGSCIFIISVAFVVLFLSGVKLKHIFSICLAGLPFFYFFIFNVSYRRNRILAFLNPWAEPRGIGFQLIQSYLAFGSGGFLGTGLGQSKQKLFYLPASHTDFVFSIIGEELGFAGTVTVISLFFMFFLYGFKISLSKNDTFARVLSLGIIINITFQAILNIAVTTGMIPTKGLPLPFISYGGTNLLVNMVQVGILLNISKNAV